MSEPALPPSPADYEDRKAQGIPTELLKKPVDKLSIDSLLPHLMHLEIKDVTLKYIFDHVRNYAICGVLIAAGVKGLSLNVTNKVSSFIHIVGGIALVLTAIVLFMLNFMHGITAFSKIRNLSTLSKAVYIITTVFLFMGAFALIFPHIG